MILSLPLIPLCGLEPTNIEGFLNKSRILVAPESFEGARDHVFEEKYVLYLLEPIQTLLPTGVKDEIYFVVIEMPNEFERYVTKYVTLEGEWNGVALPSFVGVPILRADRISADHWINWADPKSEEVTDYVDELIVRLAPASCSVARWIALASGHRILEVEGNELVEISPDGSKRVIESLPPRMKVKKGAKLIIKEILDDGNEITGCHTRR